MIARVASLHIYPIKSCAGLDVESVEIGARGPQFDREWMVVDAPTGAFLTQRQIAKMALVKTGLPDRRPVSGDGRKLQIIFGAHEFILPDTPGTTREVKVWADACLAEEPLPEASRALSDFLAHEVRLVRMGREFKRRLPEKYSPTAHTGFADQFPFLLTASESLRDLNGRLAQPVPMDRFRSNIVIEGAPAFTEDGWRRIRIGAVEFDVPKKCERCMIVNTDQKTADRGIEPLKTLASFRRSEKGKALFGQNMIHVQTGSIRIGDAVTVL